MWYCCLAHLLSTFLRCCRRPSLPAPQQPSGYGVWVDIPSVAPDICFFHSFFWRFRPQCGSLSSVTLNVCIFCILFRKFRSDYGIVSTMAFTVCFFGASLRDFLFRCGVMASLESQPTRPHPSSSYIYMPLRSPSRFSFFVFTLCSDRSILLS